MKEDNIRSLVQYRMEQANEALEVARLVIAEGHYREVVNRAYYAMFYAVLALLCVGQKETAKHSGAISLFDLDYVKPGTFSKEFSHWLHEAFNLRLKSDYAPLFVVSKESAEEALGHAARFVEGVRGYLSKWLAPGNERDER